MSHSTLQNIKQIALQDSNLTSKASDTSREAAEENVVRNVNKSVDSVEFKNQPMETQQHELLDSDSNNNNEIDLINCDIHGVGGAP
ncbi:predicted protein [Uncinocarpus reesii 1704]|uniref:Uncharacterized protein n=1 Tax=Uncinocarpus reesii (strain UAMH 1704) TaxID=336963 RepID=C4JR68_UNCRE|nr:uncharacterized protein UREG_03550 [Uncinocarpus reesii 1704]EEP78704.1 predicted protein [Uncinocarpus reesii 1704]